MSTGQRILRMSSWLGYHSSTSVAKGPMRSRKSSETERKGVTRMAPPNRKRLVSLMAGPVPMERPKIRMLSSRQREKKD